MDLNMIEAKINKFITPLINRIDALQYDNKQLHQILNKILSQNNLEDKHILPSTISSQKHSIKRKSIQKSQISSDQSQQIYISGLSINKKNIDIDTIAKILESEGLPSIQNISRGPMPHIKRMMPSFNVTKGHGSLQSSKQKRGSLNPYQKKRKGQKVQNRNLDCKKTLKKTHNRKSKQKLDKKECVKQCKNTSQSGRLR